MKKYIAIILVVSGCGAAPKIQTGQQDWPVTDQSSVLQDFIAEGASRGKVIDLSKLKFVYSTAVSPSDWGWCSFDSKNNPIIQLAPDLAAQDRTTIEQVIFHELGHCILFRDHSGGVDITIGGPSSMMYPGLIDQTIYLNHRHQYLDEMFANPGVFHNRYGS